MDLNQLFFRHQLSLMNAWSARSADVFAIHRKHATDYAGRIHSLRSGMGATEQLILPIAKSRGYSDIVAVCGALK